MGFFRNFVRNPLSAINPLSGGIDTATNGSRRVAGSNTIKGFVRNPLTAINPISGAIDTATGGQIGGQLRNGLGAGAGSFTPGIPNLITVPGQTTGLNLPTRQGISGASSSPDIGSLTKSIGRAPEIGEAPGISRQTQQQVSGQDIQGLVQKFNQSEATTGREITGALTEGLSRAAFGESADRAAQNKSLALQEDQLALDNFRTEAGLELQQFGLDAETQLNTARLALTKSGQERDFALRGFMADLQAQGMSADQAFRISQQAINVQVQNESFRIQREAIARGVSADKANARAQGLGTLLKLGGTTLGFILGGPLGGAAGGAIGGILADSFDDENDRSIGGGGGAFGSGGSRDFLGGVAGLQF